MVLGLTVTVSGSCLGLTAVIRVDLERKVLAEDPGVFEVPGTLTVATRGAFRRVLIGEIPVNADIPDIPIVSLPLTRKMLGTEAVEMLGTVGMDIPIVEDGPIQRIVEQLEELATLEMEGAVKIEIIATEVTVAIPGALIIPVAEGNAGVDGMLGEIMGALTILNG